MKFTEPKTGIAVAPITGKDALGINAKPVAFIIPKSEMTPVAHDTVQNINNTATTSYLPKTVGEASVAAIGVASRTAEEQIAAERKMIARRAFIKFLLHYRILWKIALQNAAMTGHRFTRDDPVGRLPP